MLGSRFARILAGVLMVVAVSSAGATDVVGRVVDVSDTQVFSGALVNFRVGSVNGPRVATDSAGFFKVSGLSKGAYVLDIQLPDGRSFASRVLVSGLSKTQFIEIDYSRSVSPDDEDDY
ncbi:carboxypeptidase family protein [Jezberella montanilacus]|uniref:Carboxypeptidase family protein n=1 Tax=Jezberella montanilacus TaxID=323426 RepID=A0A2T0XKN9_9BURK|nr:hypothetical protein [Jezberella montanilacus]PRY99524.1 carboxypeptidase family protein [Jezberella montanilacus]